MRTAQDIILKPIITEESMMGYYDKEIYLQGCKGCKQNRNR